MIGCCQEEVVESSTVIGWVEVIFVSSIVIGWELEFVNTWEVVLSNVEKLEVFSNEEEFAGSELLALKEGTLLGFSLYCLEDHLNNHQSVSTYEAWNVKNSIY